jgi:uncharacterized damage-inducible protein DinB
MMKQLLSAQYNEIKGARSALFAYCESMKQTDLFKPVEVFNNSSIADLLVHNANTYISWINNFGLDGNSPFYKTESFKNLGEIKSLFEKVDQMVADLLEKFQGDYEQPLTGLVKHRGFKLTKTPLQLYTQAVTHEFHHKGQIVTMSRLLGYTPVDTDVIRF